MVYYVRQGDWRYGEILFNVNTDTGYIRAGGTSVGSIIGQIDGNRIRLGNAPIGIGETFLIREGNNLRTGNSIYGPIFANICHEGDCIYIREGNMRIGKILFNLTTF